jgi:DNA-binding IclR family transcriptional regulator
MYALPQTLAECGRVRTDATGPLYSVGIRALLTSFGIRSLLTGTSRLERDPYVRTVRRHLDEASDALGEAIHLARVDGSDMTYLATRDSHEYRT